MKFEELEALHIRLRDLQRNMRPSFAAMAGKVADVRRKLEAGEESYRPFMLNSRASIVYTDSFVRPESAAGSCTSLLQEILNRHTATMLREVELTLSARVKSMDVEIDSLTAQLAVVLGQDPKMEEASDA